MGSFYATCSITNQTITDGQEMYMQFMLPSRYVNETNSGSLFVESFLSVVKEKGLEEALKTWEEATKTWGDKNDLSSKGLVINDTYNSEWIPFGPAIRGTYDDYGNIAPANDEDSQNRVKILEGLMGGLPFDTIMEVAQDDRWFTLGLGKYKDNNDSNNNWRPEGIDKDMPEWLLELCKKLSLTYFHASVYDEMRQEDFCPSNVNGTWDKYDKEWKEEYTGKIKEQLPKVLEHILTIGNGSEEPENIRGEILLMKFFSSCRMFECLSEELRFTYLASMARENQPLDWFYETISFMYSLGSMQLTLRQSYYGSQNTNWFGWKRINEKLNPKIEEKIIEYGYYENEEDEE